MTQQNLGRFLVVASVIGWAAVPALSFVGGNSERARLLREGLGPFAGFALAGLAIALLSIRGPRRFAAPAAALLLVAGALYLVYAPLAIVPLALLFAGSLLAPTSPSRRRDGEKAPAR